MLSKLRSRLTYANVMSSIAVFLALGGSAYAVAANSVGTAQLKNGAVTNPKLAKDAVATGKVLDGSLLRRDFRDGQVPFDHYVTVDLPAPSAGNANGDAKTLLVKGLLRLTMICNRLSDGTSSTTVVASSSDENEKFTASDPRAGLDTTWGGQYGATTAAHQNTLYVAATGLQSGFWWAGARPLSVVNRKTSIDGVLSYGTNGYHTCEASFFGG